MTTRIFQARFYRYDKRIERKLKEKLVEHLISLSIEDRRMRFFSPVNDTSIKQYVEKLGENDELFFAIKSLNGFDFKVSGFLHVAKLKENDSYELGVTVDSNEREHGIATNLFNRAFLYIRSQGCKKIFINCLSTNTTMQKIVEKYKLRIEKDPDDPHTKIGVLELNSGSNFYAFLEGLKQDQIALFDLALSKLMPSVA